MTANHYPDGLTPEAITALQREVDDALRQEGYPVPPWPDLPWLPVTRIRRRRTNRPSQTTGDPVDDAPATDHRVRTAPPVTGEQPVAGATPRRAARLLMTSEARHAA